MCEESNFENLITSRALLDSIPQNAVSAKVSLADLRPARSQRTIHTPITTTKLLFEGVSARDGARFGARTTMATATYRTTAVGITID
jgi:hypothetical protein